MAKDFLSDAEMAALESQGHAKDVYHPSKLESLGRGALQGATLGYSDEITGMGEAALDKLRGSDKDVTDLYAQHRDESRLNNQSAREENPKSYLAGNLAGGVGTAMATGGVGAGIKGAALVGGVAGLGNSNASNISDAALDTAKGAGMGAGFGLVAKGIGAAAAPASRWLKGVGEDAADDAFNTSGVGRELLDSGDVNPLQSSQSKLDSINEAITPLKNEKNALLSNDPSSYDMDQIANNVRQRMGIPKTDNEAASMQKVFNEVNSAAQRTSGQPVNASYLDDVQGLMGAQAKFNKQTFANPGDEFASQGFRDAYGTMGDALKANNPGIAPLNQKMNGLINAQDAVGSRNLNPVSLMTKYGAAKAIGNNVNAAKAITADTIANILQTNPQSLGKYAAVLSQSAQRSPESLKASLHVLQMSDPDFRVMSQQLQTSSQDNQ